jgi:hypothetical protein
VINLVVIWPVPDLSLDPSGIRVRPCSNFWLQMVRMGFPLLHLLNTVVFWVVYTLFLFSHFSLTCVYNAHRSISDQGYIYSKGKAEYNGAIATYNNGEVPTNACCMPLHSTHTSLTTDHHVYFLSEHCCCHQEGSW